MAINFSNVTAVTLGADDVVQIEDSLGTVLWQKAQPLANYFYIEDISGSSNTVSIKKYDSNGQQASSAPTLQPYFSTDQQNWYSAGTTSTTPITYTVPANSRLYIKCTTNAWGATNAFPHNQITCTGQYNVGGNAMSLIYGDNFENTVFGNSNNGALFGLFYGSTTLVNAGSLLLPSDVVSTNCYMQMFMGCTNLVSTPTLPATQFLTNGGYTMMFEGCSSLTTAPALSATANLPQYYCRRMFAGCTSLTETPVLPATTVPQNGYNEMFYGCSRLNKVYTYANTISASQATTNWLNNVAATGDFYALGSANWAVNSPNGIPTGWTKHNVLPVPYNVSISAGNNGSVSVNGVSGNYSASVAAGTTLTLEATADAGYYFTAWSDGDNNATRTITVTGDLTLTAAFVQVMYYNVSISAVSNGSVSVNGVSGDYSQSVAAGTVLTIEGTGDAGYNFDQWSDGVYTNPRTITVTGDLTLSASFVQAVMANYFYVEDASGNDNTLLITKSNSGSAIEVFASTDQQTWTSMGTTSGTSITATIPANRRVYLKATTDSTWGTNNDNIGNYITATGNYNIGGNIMSLVYGDNFENTVLPDRNGIFANVFRGSITLVSAANLVLPTNAVHRCYPRMFQGCTSLTTAPALPATTLPSRCYEAMFYHCSSLTAAPALPATTVASTCYFDMFNGCTSLTTAPAILPATTLDTYCYTGMFNGCSSLTETPVLPATTLTEACYHGMFNGCSRLNKVYVYANTLGSNSTTNWLNNVAATGDFYALGSANWAVNSPSGVPVGWTLHHSLPGPFYVEDASGSSNTVTILKNDANAPTIEVFKSTDGTNWTSMGNTSTSGITATVPANSKLYLKATTNGWRTPSGVYYHKIGCSGNFKIGGHIASLLFGDNYSGATLTSTNNYAFEDLFSSNDYLLDASDLVLPDTTAASCYTGMFEYSHNLAGAPVLPATTLADSCYVRIFRDCNSINEIICYADTLGTNSTYQWLAGVASSGDFYKLGSATFASGASGIPTNWTTHNSL